MNLAKSLLRIAGWHVEVKAPDYPKCVICVAPHTSNWDFILGMLAYRSVGRKAGFMMKKAWFFFPLGYLLRALGGIPIDRSRSNSMVDNVVDMFKHTDHLAIAITPEGTRKRTTRWRTGILRIALGADVPLVLGAFDFRHKRIIVNDTFSLTPDIDDDLRRLKLYYQDYTGKHPEKFATFD